MGTNFSDTPRENLEAQLTALLLGELTDEEAKAVREAVAHDPALAELSARLAHAAELVREAALQPVDQFSRTAEPVRLSTERRQELLQTFKTIAPKELAPAGRSETWYIPMSLAAVLVAMIGSVALLPVFVGEKRFSKTAFLFTPEQKVVLPRLAEPATSPTPEKKVTDLSELHRRTTAELPEARTDSRAVQRQTGDVTGSGGGSSGGVAFGLNPADRRDSTSLAVQELARIPYYLQHDRMRGAALSVKKNLPQPKADEVAKTPTGSAAATAGPTSDFAVLNFYSKPFDTVAQHKDEKLSDANGTIGYKLEQIPNLGDAPAFGQFFREAKPVEQQEASRQIEGNLGKEARALPPHADSVAGPRPDQQPGRPLTASESVRAKIEPGLLQRYGLAPRPDALPDRVAPQPQVAVNDAVETEVRKLGNMPNSERGKVTIVDPADAETRPTLWARVRGAVTGKAERTVRLEIERDNPGIAPLVFGGDTHRTFDPYFIQTEFEKIKSKAVLSKVAEKLKLNEVWAPREGEGQKLSEDEVYQRLAKNIDVRQRPNSPLVEIRVIGERPEEAAQIANTVAGVYRDLREEVRQRDVIAEENKRLELLREQSESLGQKVTNQAVDVSIAKPTSPRPIPQSEITTSEHPFSTFSLNVTDVSFKLAAASLEKGVIPEPASIRSEEFLNAFQYRDPEPASGAAIAFAWERARSPFAQDRDLLRLSLKTAATGRDSGRPLNLVLLLDRSGSMERADRVRVVQEALRVLAGQLQPQDRLSVITFARTARLWAEGVSGNRAGEILAQAGSMTPEGGTNLEDALHLAYQTAVRQYLEGGVNRVVLLTDGAANLGNVDPASLKGQVETHRQKGIALDCFGIGWEGFDDDVLQVLSSHGDGRYGFLNTPEEAAHGFADQLAGALQVAAADVKVQVQFNPERVSSYRQIGYAKHQLTQEQFRDNTVDAAEIGAAESGNALYVIQVNPNGNGPVGVVRVRYKTPGAAEVIEQEWTVPFTGSAVALDESSPAMRLAAVAAAFSEWLISSPYAAEVTPDRLLRLLSGVSDAYHPDSRPQKLEWMIRQSK